MSLFDRLKKRGTASLVLYTRRECGLCDEMKEEIERAGLRARYELEEVDIEGDPELEERFGLSIPVLTIEGRVAFKGKLTAEAFEKKLKRLAPN